MLRVHYTRFRQNVLIILCLFPGGAKSKMPPTLSSIEKSQQIANLQHKIRLARTISREPEVKESSVDDDDDDDDGQVSAV